METLINGLVFVFLLSGLISLSINKIIVFYQHLYEIDLKPWWQNEFLQVLQHCLHAHFLQQACG